MAQHHSALSRASKALLLGQRPLASFVGSASLANANVTRKVAPILRTYVTAYPRKEKVVLLGSGWAGIQLAKKLDKSKYELSVVSPVNHFVFTPLLASSAVGTLEFRNVTEAVRKQAKGAKYYEATAEKIDLQGQQVLCSANQSGETRKYTLDYDKLIIACGGVINTFGTPGVHEYGTFLKTIADARKIRARLIECFEQASRPGVSQEEQRQLLHFAVVGGGPTGVEFSGELRDFIDSDAKRIYPDLVDKVTLTIFDVAPKILAAFNENLVEYVKNKYAKDKIQIRTGTIIKKVHQKHLELKDQPDVPYGLLVWSTGITARPLIADLPVAKDRTRRIVTDSQLHVYGLDEKVLPNVYALGDCATVKDGDLPPTAQVAKQKALFLSKALNGQMTSPFLYNHAGSMAYVGGWRAVVQLNSRNIKGFLGFLMWRSAYLNMTISAKNKILLLVNWTLSWLCGRDVSRFP